MSLGGLDFGVHEVGAFLRGFRPFDTISDSDLNNLVMASQIEFFPEGSFLIRTGDVNEGFAHVIRTGQVELLEDGRVVDVLGPGDMVGLPSLVADLAPGLDARAAEDVLAYRLPAEALLPALMGRSGLKFVARTVRQRSALAEPGPLDDRSITTTGSLVRPAVTVESSATVLDVVRAMQYSHASCALVRMPDGQLGIITDHDLRNRVLAAEVSRSIQVGTVATCPALVVAPELPSDDAVLVMLAYGVRHLPVVTPFGVVVGVVDDVDLLAAQSRTPVRLRREISRASNPHELAAVALQIRPAIVGAARAGQQSVSLSATLGALDEAVVVKAIELHLRDREGPSVPFVWLVTGSVARRESSLSSDLDSLVAWDGDDQDPIAVEWIGRLVDDVLSTLRASGLSLDQHGVRPDDARFARSLDAWLTAVRTWADDPITGQGEIYLATLADARPVWGHGAWDEVADAVTDAYQRLLVRHTLYRVATLNSPPTGFIRDLVIESSGRHAGTLDLKAGGILPCVAIGRYLAALVPLRSVGTVDRVRGAAAKGLLTADEARDLTDAMTVVQSMRMEQQVEAYTSGGQVGDRIRPDSLTTLQRSCLRDAFRVIAKVQRLLPPPDLRT